MYKEALANELIEDGDDVGHLLNLPLRTHSRNVPTGRPAPRKPIHGMG
jgi:hypothetical protein